MALKKKKKKHKHVHNFIFIIFIIIYTFNKNSNAFQAIVYKGAYFDADFMVNPNIFLKLIHCLCYKKEQQNSLIFSSQWAQNLEME